MKINKKEYLIIYFSKKEPEQPKLDKNKQRKPVAPNLSASRGRKNQNLIQSHSIFEAGPAESTKRCKNN